MAGLRQTVIQREMEESVVDATTTQCVAALPPCTRVPMEIWQKIFSTLCLSMYDYTLDSNHYSPDSPLLGLPTLVVSQVCSHWRGIVERMPRLWATINLNFSRLAYKPNILEIYLVNSGSYPLKLRLETENNGRINEFTPRTPDLWGLLYAHIPRLGEFIIATWNLPHALSLPPIPNFSLPHLERYEEERGALFDAHPSLKWLWKAIMEAPKVTTFTTLTFLPRDTGYSSRLTSWTIHVLNYGPDVDALLDVLEECASLQSLTLLDVSCIDDTYTSNSVVPIREVKVPSLRKFFVRGAPHIDGLIPGILCSLKLPSLQSFSIEYPEWPLPSALLEMIQCSSKSLEMMCIRLTPWWKAVSSQDSLLLDILQATPEVTDFKLFLEESLDASGADGRTFVGEMVSPLVSEPEDKLHYFLPKLGSITLKLPNYLIDAQLVRRFIEVVSARQCTPHPLRDVRLVHFENENSTLEGEEEEEGFEISDEPELLEKLRELEDGGAKVVVEPQYEG
ncbi:hypothetical protein L218DRAFT_999136 [Marasmius fiardii PR-910]|nr:hypothetical protein L218DRAFT_999136 [Marasmius fiardii PR-910]